jgi:hypothetical protein
LWSSVKGTSVGDFSEIDEGTGDDAIKCARRQ